MDTNALSLFDIARNFFREDDWLVIPLDDRPILHTTFRGSHGMWSCFVEARETEQQLVFYSLCPINVSADKRSAVAEFLSRANYGLTIGNFEIDFEDGEVRYKTSIDVENDRLSSALVKQLVYANVVITDQYLPGLLAVIYGEMSPLEAIAQIEGT